MIPDPIPTAVRVTVPNTPRGTVTFHAVDETAARRYLDALLSALPRVDKASVTIRTVRNRHRGEVHA